MVEDILKAIPIGFGLAFMIGPVFFKLIQTSILKGARAAIVFDIGVVAADIVFILFAFYGSHQFLTEIKDDPNLFFVGGGILIIYGLSTYFRSKTELPTTDNGFVIPEKKNYLGLFVKGFFLNFINVGVLAFWLIMVLGVSSALSMDVDRIFRFFTAIIIAYFITDIGKIVLAKQLKSKLTPIVITKIKKGMGIALIIFGLVLVVKGFIPPEDMSIDDIIDKVQ
ncbi:MAG: lysine transporter LysE [Bacteroidetes bacterium MedPE-SWsnd-G1]|nr:MAG: lysine transporter LysE [Bacteroidetes bacterium MedPE-SWsnd-G1]